MKYLLGCIAALAAMGLVALVVIFSGQFDAAASAPHGPLVAWATHKTMLRWAAVNASPAAPPRFTSQDVAAGFRDYDHSCAMCHGGPGVARADWAKGLNPTPPYLLDSARRFTPQELYLIVGRGVKMTAMPAWEFTRSDRQLWDLVAFLEALPDVTPADYARLRQAAAQPPPKAAP